ncbi:hypothetical protein L1987_03785 [Smallanthus sonchifolius]|uniref:Uncharacterized protein n=1 Tax=Smallanthus sonchifolius TaxID=185202 RepID=A0ACB9KBQ8_9ASTR|nr:hypothetical protein L1987_03785 [Smallanthus sonchifolius]
MVDHMEEAKEVPVSGSSNASDTLLNERCDFVFFQVSLHQRIAAVFFAVLLHQFTHRLPSIKCWPLMPPLPSYGYGRGHPGPRYESFIHGQNFRDVVIIGFLDIVWPKVRFFSCHLLLGDIDDAYTIKKSAWTLEWLAWIEGLLLRHLMVYKMLRKWLIVSRSWLNFCIIK